jgi:hypothetical protein
MRSAARPQNELTGKKDVAWHGALRANPLGEQLTSCAAELSDRLTHGGQRW